ncbi:MAG: hypothetical protein FWD94_01675 [Treponema sp.]|nr:hypothetical protein [Treponema sp.]
MIIFARAGLLSILLLFSACDYGELGDADKTDTYMPGDAVFDERMDFFDGIWKMPGNGDGYHIRRWGDLDGKDETLETAELLFPNLDTENLKTWSTKENPSTDDFVLLYNGGGPYEDEWGGTSYMGIVRAINIFNDDLDRGAIIIEYFEGADPEWLSTPGFNNSQGLRPGEVPFFGIHYRGVADKNWVQMANAVNLAALYAGKLYYVEQRSFEDALRVFTVKKDSEWIDWGIVMPQKRQ